MTRLITVIQITFRASSAVYPVPVKSLSGVKKEAQP